MFVEIFSLSHAKSRRVSARPENNELDFPWNEELLQRKGISSALPPPHFTISPPSFFFPPRPVRHRLVQRKEKKVGRSFSPPSPFFPPPPRYICAKAAKAMDGMRQASLAHGRLGHKGEAKRESPFCMHDRKSRVAIMCVL